MKDHHVPESSPAIAEAKTGSRPIKQLLSLALLTLCAWLIASCSNNARKSASPTPSPTGDDRSFSSSSKRFERPPPYGSRFNND